jgi:NADP-dependent 3-hydroxy acid dehydrogenase YdfG
MSQSLEERVVAITGASSGIGEATALRCARAGAAIALAARRADRIEALAARIEEEGGRAVAIPTDVGDERQARAFVEQAYERLGRLDALVNNAGLMLLGPVEGADTEQWRRMVHVNVLGVLYCTHAAFPVMKRNDPPDRGHIVNVSSVAGRYARAGSAVYNLTKWGVNGFSEALRQEALHAGIRVTLIEPGAVATELISHNTEMVQQAAAQTFAGVEALRAEDIAEAVHYALSQPGNVAINEILIRPAGQER